jgi:protein tyrosine/serine phosphatase
MSAPPDAVRARPAWKRRAVRAVLAAALAAAGLYAGYVLVGPNFHTVIPGAAYRAAQPSAAGLERLIRRLGVRTVVNLRGCCDPLPWYLEQCRVTNRLNVSQEDLGFSASRLPSTVTMRQLIDVLDRSEYPILFHCHKGADRSGMASAIVLLLRTDTPLAEARKQLGPRYGHLPIGRTQNIDRFFDLYEEWLAARGVPHTPEVFRHWATEEYCPGECRASFEVLSPAGQPYRAQIGQPIALRVRCYNTSVKPWRLRPGNNAGIHATFHVVGDDGRLYGDGRGGLMDATVAPGEAIDLTLAVRAPPLWGRYEVRVDMVDEQHAYFMQTGSEPLVWKLEVVP